MTSPVNTLVAIEQNSPSDEQGYILHEDNDIVVIATGFLRPSSNRKTGEMIQVHILYRWEKPTEALKSGNDAKICFDCPHRPIFDPSTGTMKRPCYVPMRGENSIYRAYVAGSYPHLSPDHIPQVFAGLEVRFGAYGETVLIPLAIVRAIVAVAKKWTGYTHQWRKAQYQEYRAYFMASCDSVADRMQADVMGWRSFRVRTADTAILPGEIICPASDEGGKKTQCVRCGLCNGSTGTADARKDIVIIVHGTGAKNFVSVDELLAA